MPGCWVLSLVMRRRKHRPHSPVPRHCPAPKWRPKSPSRKPPLKRPLPSSCGGWPSRHFCWAAASWRGTAGIGLNSRCSLERRAARRTPRDNRGKNAPTAFRDFPSRFLTLGSEGYWTGHWRSQAKPVAPNQDRTLEKPVTPNQERTLAKPVTRLLKSFRRRWRVFFQACHSLVGGPRGKATLSEFGPAKEEGSHGTPLIHDVDR